MTTWNQVTSLSGQQQVAMERFRQIGLVLNNEGPPPDISTVTDAQAKNAAQFLNQDLYVLTRATEAGIRYVREFYRTKVVKDYEDSLGP